MAQVRVFYTGVAWPLPAAQLARIAARLSPDYHGRLKRLTDRRAREATLAALGLLEDVVEHCQLDAPPLSRLLYPPDGAPRWRDGPVFSLAHTDGLIACAVIVGATRARLGIDVERVRPIAADALRHVVSAEELERTQDAPREILQSWTRREAVLKAAGMTLRRIRDVEISTDGARARFDGLPFVLRTIAFPEGHVGALATDVPIDAPLLAMTELHLDR